MKNLKMLKRIQRNKQINYTTSNQKTQKHLDSLKRDGYVDFEIIEKNGKYFYMFSTTPDGDEFITQSDKSDRRWRITTFIAIFAAIGAYRSELVSIGQAIMKLWKLLTGD